MSFILVLLTCAAILVGSHFLPEKKPTGYGLTFQPSQRRDNASRMAEYERRLAIVRARVQHLRDIDFPETRWQAYNEMVFSPPGDNDFWMKHSLTRDQWWWRTATTINTLHVRMTRGLTYQRRTSMRTPHVVHINNLIEFPIAYWSSK